MIDYIKIIWKISLFVYYLYLYSQINDASWRSLASIHSQQNSPVWVQWRRTLYSVQMTQLWHSTAVKLALLLGGPSLGRQLCPAPCQAALLSAGLLCPVLVCSALPWSARCCGAILLWPALVCFILLQTDISQGNVVLGAKGKYSLRVIGEQTYR